jgi:hypothetical protein
MLAHTYLVAPQPQNFTGVVNSSINGLAVSALHKVKGRHPLADMAAPFRN